MRYALQLTSWAVGLPLELMVIAALLRGGYRRFPFLFVYAIADFLITAMEIPRQLDYIRGIRNPATALSSIYWIDEVIEQVLIYAVVMSLIYSATRSLRARRILRASVIAGALLIGAVSFLIDYSPRLNPGSWMTPWMRDLNFCSAVLDLGLWALLIAGRTRDNQMLLLSGALGIKFAGESIGESVRQLAIRGRSHALSLTGTGIIMLAECFCLFVWWRALRRPAAHPLPVERQKKEPPARQAAP